MVLREAAKETTPGYTGSLGSRLASRRFRTGGGTPRRRGLQGVAARPTRRLNAIGIQSILDLSRADPVMIRDRFSVVMMRTVLDLQGTPCIPLEEERIGRDQLIFSRSFSTPITTSAELRQVLSVYAQQATVCIPLPMPTADPVLLTRTAHGLLPAIQDGSKYVRAGIMVTDVRPTGIQKPSNCSRTFTRSATSARSWRKSAAGTAGAQSGSGSPGCAAALIGA
jgi:hypothetical protein